MLGIIIGAALTTAAWKRGWKGWAILPLPLALVAQFVCGFFIGATASPGTTLEDLEGIAIAVDLALYLIAGLVLVGMIIKGRKPKVAVDPVVGPIANSYRSVKYCAGCGQEIADNARFCRRCGLTVSPADASSLMGNNQEPQPAR